jgi:hypothetical protein
MIAGYPQPSGSRHPTSQQVASNRDAGTKRKVGFVIRYGDPCFFPLLFLKTKGS